jgi:hypothetical protein
MPSDARIPPITYLPTAQPTLSERRRVFTLSREVRQDGTIESRDEARRRYNADGLETPEPGEAYFDG